MLCGVDCGPTGQLAWLTLYREEKTRPFSEEAGLAAFALPFVLLASPQPTIGRGRLQEESACLTAREHEVAQAYAGSGDYKSVARALALSPATVRKPSVVDLPQALGSQQDRAAPPAGERS